MSSPQNHTTQGGEAVGEGTKRQEEEEGKQSSASARYDE